MKEKWKWMKEASVDENPSAVYLQNCAQKNVNMKPTNNAYSETLLDKDTWQTWGLKYTRTND